MLMLNRYELTAFHESPKPFSLPWPPERFDRRHMNRVGLWEADQALGWVWRPIPGGVLSGLAVGF